MSTLVVKVCTVDEIKPHGAADRLEIAVIGGWQCVVGKGQYQAGDKVVYFCPDTLLPRAWAERFGVVNYLSFPKSSPDLGRIRCAKLRGEPSFGLVVDPAEPGWEIGQDVADYYGCQRYEPPVRATAGDVEVDHPLFPQFGDIDNLRNFPTVFRDGELVSISEKLDGTNCRIGIIEGVAMAGSHRLRRKEPCAENVARNTYWFPWSLAEVAAFLTWLGQSYRQAVLYGEVYGRGGQKLQYGQKGLAFAAFDLMVDGRYLGVDDFRGLCEKFGVPVVPELARVPYSLVTVKALAEGSSTLADHIREGVVVKPLMERTDPAIGRVVLKCKGDGYLLGQKEDWSDV